MGIFSTLFGQNKTKECTVQDTLSAAGKHCEHCWKKSDDARYFFIAESHLIILLKSPHVVSHDAIAKTVRLADGQVLEYDSLNGDIAYKLKPRLLPHILCGSACAMDLAKQRIMFTKELLNQTPFIDCTDEEAPFWDPMPLDPQQFEFEEQQCTQCARTFPNLHKRFTVQHIIETRVVEGVQGHVSMPAGFDLGQSDTSKQKPQGHFWFYRMRPNNDRTVHFCSDECVYRFTVSTKSVVIFPNHVLKGYMTMITPSTPEANRGLGSAYPYRPQKLWPIPE